MGVSAAQKTCARKSFAGSSLRSQIQAEARGGAASSSQVHECTLPRSWHPEPTPGMALSVFLLQKQNLWPQQVSPFSRIFSCHFLSWFPYLLHGAQADISLAPKIICSFPLNVMCDPKGFVEKRGKILVPGSFWTRTVIPCV